jgi:hypothetical protein
MRVVKAEDLKPQTVVKNRETGKFGVVVSDLPAYLSVLGPGEVSVVYDGSTVADGTDPESLEIIGPENAVADLQKCGAGKGADCCIFLVLDGKKGFECQRFGEMRWTLVFREMNAKREPKELFPRCQLDS